MNKVFDAAVIGSGPAGITAALYLVRSGCSVVIIESLTPGGQVLTTYAIENYPGFPKGIKGWELADVFAAHLDGLPLERVNAEVRSVEGAAGHFVVVTSSGQLHAKVVVIASGASHRPLGVEGEDRLRGHGVSYCAICDGNFFRGCPVAVVGGGNSALEESLYLSKIVSKVYLVHRRDEFRGAEIYQKKVLDCPNIEVILSSVVVALHGDLELKGLTARNVNTGAERDLAVDGLFVFVGIIPNSAFVPACIEQDSGGFIVTDCEMRTNVPGIFAAGDIRSKLCRQVVTATGDGATAAQAAFLFLEQLHA